MSPWKKNNLKILIQNDNLRKENHKLMIYDYREKVVLNYLAKKYKFKILHMKHKGKISLALSIAAIMLFKALNKNLK